MTGIQLELFVGRDEIVKRESKILQLKVYLGFLAVIALFQFGLLLHQRTTARKEIVAEKVLVTLKTEIGDLNFHPRFETVERMLQVSNGAYSIKGIEIKGLKRD